MDAKVVDRRKRLEADQLVWMIHEEIVKRVGANRHFAIAVAPKRGGGWVVRQPSGGRPLIAEVQEALKDVEREFQKSYRLKRSRVQRETS